LPGVLATISACNIPKLQHFLREPEMLLFAYWKYHGVDFAADANGRRSRHARLVEFYGPLPGAL
jgi:L-rhamnose mutarotase